MITLTINIKEKGSGKIENSKLVAIEPETSPNVENATKSELIISLKITEDLKHFGLIEVVPASKKMLEELKNSNDNN